MPKSPQRTDCRLQSPYRAALRPTFCALLLVTAAGLASCSGGEESAPLDRLLPATLTGTDWPSFEEFIASCEGQPRGQEASPRGSVMTYRVPPHQFVVEDESALIKHSDRQVEIGFPEAYLSASLPGYRDAAPDTDEDSGHVTRWLVEVATAESARGAVIHVPVWRTGTVNALISERPDGEGVLLSCNLYTPLLQGFADHEAATGASTTNLESLLALYSADERRRDLREEALARYREITFP